MAKYTRTFKIKLEEQTEPISIAPLTCGQTDAFLLEQRSAIAETEGPARQTRLEQNMYQLVVHALNNANGTVLGQPEWTIEKIKEEFDKQQLDAMVDLAMAKSGLIIPNQNAPAIP